MYLAKETRAWYYGMDDGIKIIASHNGFHQGDVLASWAYCMTLQPYLEHLQHVLGEQFPNERLIIHYYVDDGNFVAPHHVLLAIIADLKSNSVYTDFGFKLNQKKGFILMGKCHSPEEADFRYNELLEAGVEPSVIKIHPENRRSTSSSGDSDYGAVLLGSYIGTDQFIRAKLREYVEDLKKIGEKLKKFPNLQGRMLLFRNCFLTKPLHILRTVRYDLTVEFVGELEKIQKEVLISILGCDSGALDEDTFSQCCLQFGSGGLGMHMYSEVAPAAFCASFLGYVFRTGFADTFEEISEGRQPVSPRVAAFIQTLALFSNEDNPFQAAQKLHEMKLERRETLQNKLTYMLEDNRKKELITKLERDLPKLRWFTSIQSSIVSRFLCVIPKFKDYSMANEEYRVAILRYLQIPNPRIHPALHCDCDRRPQLDPFGHHIVTACPKHRIPTEIHDYFKTKVNQLLHWAGLWTVVEEVNTFGDVLIDDRHRADIVIKNPGPLHYPNNGTKILVDFSFTCPVEGIANGQEGILDPRYNRNTNKKRIKDAKTQGLAAKHRYNEKIKKYDDLIAEYNSGPNEALDTFTVVPFVAETSGYFHEKAVDFLDRVADYCQEVKKFHSQNSKSYFLNVLSICLQTQIARAIIRRVAGISSHADGPLTDRLNTPMIDYIIGEEDGGVLV